MLPQAVRRVGFDRSGHPLFARKGLTGERLGLSQDREDKVIGFVLFQGEEKGAKGSRPVRLREDTMPA